MWHQLETYLNHANFSESSDQAADDVKEVDVVDLMNKPRLACISTVSMCSAAASLTLN